MARWILAKKLNFENLGFQGSDLAVPPPNDGPVYIPNYKINVENIESCYDNIEL